MLRPPSQEDDNLVYKELAAWQHGMGLAEGYCRRTTKAYIHHVSIALGSHGELETCLELSSRLGLITEPDRKDLEDSCRVVGKLLSGLYNSLKQKTRRLP